MNSTNTFSPQACTSYLNAAFIPQTVNACHSRGGETRSQIKTKWKRLNQSVNLLEFGLSVLGVCSCLRVARIKGVVGI